MATSEADYQTGLLVELKAQGAHAFKLWSAYGRGFLDLYVKLPGLRSAFVELKFEKAPKRKGTLVPVKLTPNQRAFIRREQRAGGVAGWSLCVRNEDGSHDIYASACAGVDKVVPRETCFVGTKRRGQEWNAKGIIERIESECEACR